MTRLSWLRSLFARPVTRPIRKAPARRRQRLEELEDRLAPATFDVTSLADDGSAGTLRYAITQANAINGPDTILPPRWSTSTATAACRWPTS
jgi:hypothetical protein